MTRFYYKTGYKDKIIERKIIITEDLVPEVECIEINNNKPTGKGFIKIKYFDKEFIYTSIKELIDDLVAASN